MVFVEGAAAGGTAAHLSNFVIPIGTGDEPSASNRAIDERNREALLVINQDTSHCP